MQVVVLTNHTDALTTAQKLRSEWVVRIDGVVNERPEKMRVDGANGNIEIEALTIVVLSQAVELPFEKDTEVNLDTLLNNLPLTLRSERMRAIFIAQAKIIKAFRDTLIAQDFTEFQSPALVGGDAEGGAAVFPVEYYYGKKAYLASSPQLYKQIMVGALERVFSTTKVFRAEKSATTRHLSEYVSLDMEMGFITDHTDIMTVVERVVSEMMHVVPEETFSILNTEILPHKRKSLKHFATHSSRRISQNSNPRRWLVEMLREVRQYFRLSIITAKKRTLLRHLNSINKLWLVRLKECSQLQKYFVLKKALQHATCLSTALLIWKWAS